MTIPAKISPDRREKIETGLRRGLEWISKNFLPGKEPYSIMLASVGELLPDIENDEIAETIAQLAAAEIASNKFERPFCNFMQSAHPTEH